LKFFAKNFVKKNFYLLLHPMRIVPNKILCGLAVLFSSVAFANPGPPPPPVPVLPGLPIDDGICFLLAAAIAYGSYKMYQLKVNKKAPM